MDTAYFLEQEFPTPPTNLLFRRAWLDPLFYLVVASATGLLYVTSDFERNTRLEAAIGYSGTRLTVIVLLIMFLWGTTQGIRGKMVVYIDDEITPCFQDAAWTFTIVLGAPAIAGTVWLLLSLGSWLFFPATISPLSYDAFGIYLMCTLWVIGAIWMFARLYAYNRNALCAATAFVARLGWCLFGLACLNQAQRDLENEQQLSTYTAASNFITHMAMFFLSLLIIGKLTYHGPSLRR